jgi:ABC-type glutathione transport system ATPase component
MSPTTAKGITDMSNHAVLPSQSEAQSPAVQTQALGKRFGTRAALEGVDLEVPRGAAFGFLGPNGAGKTTLIRLLLGLAEPSAGRMSLLGRDIPAQLRCGARSRRRDHRGATLSPASDRARESGRARRRAGAKRAPADRRRA